MPLHELTPMLYTRDLNGSVEFYTNVLGFECRDLREEWGWASLHRDSVYIMLAIPNEHLPFDKPTTTISLYLILR